MWKMQVEARTQSREVTYSSLNGVSTPQCVCRALTKDHIILKASCMIRDINLGVCHLSICISYQRPLPLLQPRTGPQETCAPAETCKIWTQEHHPLRYKQFLRYTWYNRLSEPYLLLYLSKSNPKTKQILNKW